MFSLKIKEIWKAGVIDKLIRRLTYAIKESKTTIKRHENKIRKRYSENINNQKEKPMKVIFDLFGVSMLLVGLEEKRSSKRKRTFSGTMEIDPKRKEYNFQGK